MSFQILPLSADPFRALYGLDEAALAAHGVVRRVADKSNAFPCRVSLRDADPGEAVFLLNYEHLAVASPYRARHAIFVRDGAEPFHPAPDEVPEVLGRRLLAVRSYDEAGMMLDAEIVEGRAVAPVLERLLGDPHAAFLHLHNARPGCYAAKVVRL
jgi:Protein of unknown function (DUF1203)